jgi:hypothetical protein
LVERNGIIYPARYRMPETMRKELYRALAELSWDEAKRIRMVFVPDRAKRSNRSRP